MDLELRDVFRFEKKPSRFFSSTRRNKMQRGNVPATKIAQIVIPFVRFHHLMMRRFTRALVVLCGLALAPFSLLFWPTMSLAWPAQSEQQSSDDCWSKNTGTLRDSRFDAIREKMKQQIVEYSTPSMAVAVAIDGKIVWEEACGWADKERRLRATPASLYDVGSISKTFTATGVMTQVQLGLIDLNKPANDYLGRAPLIAFVGDASQATVKLVMQHRAGLPQHANFFYENEAYRRPTMEETLHRYGIIVRPPGEAFMYANMDYGVIEYIISRVSGLTYEDFMRREVFVPLGLIHTAVGPVPELRDSTVALYSHGQRVPYMDLDQRGAGYIYSSAHDLVRFDMFHLKDHLPDQRQILKDSSIDTMVNEALPTDSGNDPGLYGLAWDIHPNKYGAGLTSVRHTGGMLGAAAVLELIPSKHIAIAVLTNSRDAKAVTLSEDIVAALIPSYAKQRSTEPAPETPPSRPPFRPSPELVGIWKGIVKTWSGELPIRLDIRPDGDIHVKFADQLEGLLTRIEIDPRGLSGSFPGYIPTEDADRDRHTSVFLDYLVLRGDTMTGAALADGGSHYALPSWIKLTRELESGAR
jgi:CubicO group peptidase (beta-lactamase class C family)